MNRFEEFLPRDDVLLEIAQDACRELLGMEPEEFLETWENGKLVEVNLQVIAEVIVLFHLASVYVTPMKTAGPDWRAAGRAGARLKYELAKREGS